jgi:ribose transport system permease protein
VATPAVLSPLPRTEDRSMSGTPAAPPLVPSEPITYPAARATPRLAEYVGMLAALALLVALFSTLSSHFLTRITFTTLANQIPALTVIAVGMTLVLIVAGIDLSVGSVMALAAAVLGVAVAEWQAPFGVAVFLCLGVGFLAGLFNGIVSVHWAIPSFIVTLGMLEIARGGAYLVTGSRSVFVGAAIGGLGTPLRGVGLSPAFILAVVVVVAGQVLLSRTVFGRYLVAIGTNPEAVRLSGIDPRPVLVTVFALSGLLAGLGGLFHVAYLESADPNAGIGLELAAIAAVVIGGTSLMGGRGSVVSSFLGVLIIAVLQTGLAQIGATEPTKRIVTGAVIVAAVILDAYRYRLAGRRFALWARLTRRPGR